MLQMGNIETINMFPQYAWQEAGMFKQGDYLLRSGQEDPRTRERGHTIMLNNAGPIWDRTKYYLFEETFDQARKEGGLAGHAHSGKILSTAVSLALGKSDFIETHQARPNNPKKWIHPGSLTNCWNLGIKQALTCGSDFPWGSGFGNNRFFVHVKGDFTFDGWIDGLRQGKTYVSNGPIVDFTVDGRLSGSEIKLDAPKTLKVKLRARMNPTIDKLKKLTLISFDNEIASLIPSKPEDFVESILEYDLEVKESMWIAANVSGEKTIAGTTAVYVTVAGKPFWKKEGLSARIKSMENALLRLDQMIDNGVLPGGEQGKKLKSYIKQARDVYKDMRSQMANN